VKVPVGLHVKGPKRLENGLVLAVRIRGDKDRRAVLETSARGKRRHRVGRVPALVEVESQTKHTAIRCWQRRKPRPDPPGRRHALTQTIKHRAANQRFRIPRHALAKFLSLEPPRPQRGVCVGERSECVRNPRHRLSQWIDINQYLRANQVLPRSRGIDLSAVIEHEAARP
jgi:hypothetical protein